MPTVIALLGRVEKPTDGLNDYCTFLAEAFSHRGIELKKARVEWPERGWLRGLQRLGRDAAHWRGQWVLLQFTSVAWSRHAFPFGALAALLIVRWRGARTAVVYHEPRGFGGQRGIDRVRNACQEWVIRRLYGVAERPVFADPLEQIQWLPKGGGKSVFIPIGGNLFPSGACRLDQARAGRDGLKTVAVYCLDQPPHREMQLKDISEAIRFVAGNGLKIRLMFLGRGTAEARKEIDRTFGELPVEVLNLGMQRAEEVSRYLGEADAMLCVRGKLFPRRGSAMAGIACALPIVAYAGGCEGTPVADAGVELVAYRDTAALGYALGRLLEDGERWKEFHARSLRMQDEYFSWDAIAEKFVKALGLPAGPR